jgi:hypothetical protein
MLLATEVVFVVSSRAEGEVEDIISVEPGRERANICIYMCVLYEMWSGQGASVC